MKTTIAKGLTFDLLIEEVQHQDANGGQIFYPASIYVVSKDPKTDIIPALRYGFSLLIRSPLAPFFLTIYG
ncbi:hypothetical protein R1521_08060 [Rhizobium brockwellii]|uniref:Uncharacterized protein n=1 Tax=Rhizobium brockwellii TaxID=3019932 RepID=A0ABU3YHW7_9HYPH|nr:hypothetical protein [Rhizobium brockwellii]MDV4178457.1 hypothetical protein [Rhizobium brockwellii]MDV4185455.1 hypothetical protein [Rhizobium brockwellii]